jgi:ABC-type multidrug transport system ATPase subunit
VSREPLSIRVEHLTRTFSTNGSERGRVVANDDLTFSVRRGECFGLLGPNGAGKTTLISQFMGLLRPSAGTIEIEGIDVARQPDQVKRLVGFLPQSGLAMRAVEVERALRFTGRLRGQRAADAHDQAQQLMRDLELLPYANRPVQRLSGGLQRLTHFAMALMAHPQLLILDEPTNELDPHKRRLVWEVIAGLGRERKSTCVLVTHNVLEAEKVLQRVGVMWQGRLIAVGTPGEIKQQAGARVRLEFQLKEDVVCPAETLQLLAELGELEQPYPGAYRLYLAENRIVAATELLVGRLGLSRLEDFRLAPPSLEDVYLALDRGQQVTGRAMAAPAPLEMI